MARVSAVRVIVGYAVCMECAEPKRGTEGTSCRKHGAGPEVTAGAPGLGAQALRKEAPWQAPRALSGPPTSGPGSRERGLPLGALVQG